LLNEQARTMWTNLMQFIVTYIVASIAKNIGKR